MHIPELASLLGLVTLTQAATLWQTPTIPDFLRLFPRADNDICKPLPTPKLQLIDFATLEKLTRPRLPISINGSIRLSGLRPKNATVILKPTLLEFKDPAIDRFLPTFPNTTRLFIHTTINPQDRLGYPYNLVGKAIMRRGPVSQECTGTLVGTRMILTAKHCITALAAGWSLEFVLGFDGTRDTPFPEPWGVPIASAACVGVRDDGLVNGASGGVDESDYVICLLEKKIPAELGFVGLDYQEDKAFYLGRTWLSAGYPGSYDDGKVLQLEYDIELGDVVDAPDGATTFVAEPFLDKGWSGGPLFGMYEDEEDKIYAIAVASVRQYVSVTHVLLTDSRFSGGYRLSVLLQHARCEWGVTREERECCDGACGRRG
ncbi:hypothetical protein QBC39DRAFT_19564 [Podospora conica]|nr:hypothetical protein QBC39DRAFT_19564 [Schizothecium conicum]